MTRGRTNPTSIPASLLLSVPITGVVGTYVDEGSPNTAQWPATPRTRLVGGTAVGSERWAVLKFPKSLTSFRQLSFGSGFITVRLEGFAALVIGTWELELIGTDFDITAVTWNNKPAGTATPGLVILDGNVGDAESVNYNGLFGIQTVSDVAGPWFGLFWKAQSVFFSLAGDGVEGSISTMTRIVVLQTIP